MFLQMYILEMHAQKGSSFAVPKFTHPCNQPDDYRADVVISTKLIQPVI